MSPSKRLFLRTVLVVSIAIACVLAASAQPAVPRGIARITSVEGITEYKLANGLRVLLFPDPSKPTITVNITYLVGSRHESYGETGMAHLLEHLVFKGTPRHPNIPQELTEHGARPNGTTWWDRTNYFETFQATDENLQWALDLEADRMVHSFIAKKDLDSEMTVVRNEFEQGENSPWNALFIQTLATAFVWHNYGNSTIGSRADIENVSIDRLQAFYRTYYQPDNAVLLVAGKFDEAKTLELIDRFFSPIPRTARVLSKTYTLEPVQDGERSVTVRRVGDVQLVHVLYHLPAGAHQDSAACDILTELLGATPTGRLHKALVETKKAASVSASFFALREPGVAILTADVRQEASLEAAREAMTETIEGAAANPPTKDEVERARTALLKNIDLTLNSVDRIGLELSEWIAMGDWRLFFLHRDRLRSVTAEQVQRAAAAYLKPSNRTVGLFIPTPKPDRAEIPPTPDAAELVKDYRGDTAVVAGEAFDASPSNIESRTKRVALANGLKIALLSKKTRGATVTASMTFRFGDEKSLMNRSTAASLAGQMLLRGTARHSRQQIKDEFDRLKARVSVSGGPTQASASLETIRENLPAVLKLLAEVLREPAFPVDEFEQLRQERLAAVEERRSEPNAIAVVHFSRHLEPYPKGDVRYTATMDEEIADLKAARLDQVGQLYGEFYGSSNGQLAIVGDFDEREISGLVTSLLGDWKSQRPFTRVARSYTDVAPLNRSFETPDKANAFFVAGINLNLRDDDPDYPALVLGNYMLGGGFLNSRLATRLRQKEGLSYGVGSQLSASPLDKSGRFAAFAIYAPQNLGRLERAFQEEIARAFRDGFTAEEVSAARAGHLQSRMVTRAQDAPLAATLSNYLFLGRTLEWDADLERRIQALAPDRIVEAMRRHIDPAKLSIFKAGDFAKSRQWGVSACRRVG